MLLGHTLKCHKCNSRDPSWSQLGEYWPVSWFRKGIFYLRPPKPRYTKTGEVTKILPYLERPWPNGSLSLNQITLKAALLTTLAGPRIHALHTLCVIHMDQFHDKVVPWLVPATKDSLAQWVNEVMRNCGINTEIFKPHSTRVASKSAAYELGMPLREVLKRVQWQCSKAGTFFTYCFREIKD